MRDYRVDGMASMPTGCLSREPYEYLVCHRLDGDWITEKKKSMERLSVSLKGGC